MAHTSYTSDRSLSFTKMVTDSSNPARTNPSNEYEGAEFVRVSLKRQVCTVLPDTLNGDDNKLPLFGVFNLAGHIEAPDHSRAS